MSVDARNSLVQSLHDHNPWWEQGTAAFTLPARQKSDFYHLARPDRSGSQFEDQPLLGLVGRRGAGKTTLCKQFIHHRIEAGAEPERFLYLPFDADPLYQLQSDEQLRRAVRYYESRILGRLDSPEPHFIFLDDVHQIEHPGKPTIDGWGTPVVDILDEAADRYVIVTASAEVQVERELESAGFPENQYDTQPILPEKFRDYLFTLYPDLEESERRVSPTSIRSGEKSLPAALESGETGPLLDELRGKYEKIEDVEPRIQSKVVDYLAMGGTISYEHDGVIDSASNLTTTDYTRLREEVRDALYQEVPGFESIKTIADLERLCALAAHNRGSEPIRYQELVELFDVDRRTIADSYLPALADLFLLTGVTEYDNARPRSVRLYLRDTGLVTALADGNADRVLSDFGREADLARVAGFDHSMRFAYGVNAAQESESDPSVQFWRGRQGEVDFVLDIDDTPVPVVLAYRPPIDDSLDVITEFLDEYDVPVGFLLTGDTVSTEEPITLRENRVIQLPYWFYLLLC
ncbi:AAA family ATPase [Haloarchaeobius salinus]|uniref:AAA family ATPase n=1 Tax=Haloarchaeobius salinus TaxID=1198298 RepID=UPI00210B0212|nr:AAA family ATPase [Haloarchaeobius salinus]